MTLKACILAEQSAPRYTSYPTAPHFSPAVGPYTYAGWLDALEPDATLSLYLHVPYCAKLCLYCGCHTKIVRRRDPVDAYAELLGREVDRIGEQVKRRRVVSIHWGGGTPSMLGPQRLVDLTARMARQFDCSNVIEHAIEIDPRQCDAALARSLAAIGVTRASLGVQEFSPHVQEAIGRVQPFETVATAVETLRAAGIESLNFDLMYGLPHQSRQNLHEIADIFLNTWLPYGDAVVDVAGCPQKVGPSSSLGTGFVLNCLVAATVEELVRRGIEPPVWMSANLPGGDEANRKHFDKHLRRVKFL